MVWYCKLLDYLLLAVGSVVLLRGVLALYLFLRVAVTRLNEQWAAKYGSKSWALVTGCTEGIGRAFCYELAALGFNLVLVSRNEKKIDALTHDLWAKFPKLNCEVIKADFSENSA